MSIRTGESLGRKSVRILSIFISIFKKILDLPGRSHIHAHTASHHSLFLPRTGNCRGSGWWALRWSESLQNELFFQTRRRLKYMSLRHAQVRQDINYFINRIGQRKSITLIFWPPVSRCQRPVHMCLYNHNYTNMCLYVFIVHYNDKVPASLLTSNVGCYPLQVRILDGWLWCCFCACFCIWRSSFPIPRFSIRCHQLKPPQPPHTKPPKSIHPRLVRSSLPVR